MSFKTRILLSFSVFIGLVAGLGSWLFLNGLREERAFLRGRSALRVQYMVQDLDYFLNRKFRAIQTYVMLDDAAEKLQIQQTEDNIVKKFALWEKWVIAGETPPGDLAAVKAIHQEVSRLGDKTLALTDQGRKVDAIRLVENDFLPVAGKARAQLKDIKEKTEDDATKAEETVVRVARENRLTSLGAILMAIILGVVLSMRLYSALMRPMKVITLWADQIGKGHLQVALDLPGGHEMSHLAKNFNEMVKNLAVHEQRKDRVKEEKINTLEEAIDGFRDVLNIMGTSPLPKPEKKSHKI